MTMLRPDGAPAPQLRGIPASWRQADQEAKFWQEHFEELLHKYADQFVAVVNGEVVSASDDLEIVIGELQSRGLSLKDAWIKFITANPRGVLL